MRLKSSFKKNAHTARVNFLHHSLEKLFRIFIKCNNVLKPRGLKPSKKKSRLYVRIAGRKSNSLS
jgi:hypothetical protein